MALVKKREIELSSKIGKDRGLLSFEKIAPLQNSIELSWCKVGPELNLYTLGGGDRALGTAVNILIGG